MGGQYSKAAHIHKWGVMDLFGRNSRRKQNVVMIFGNGEVAEMALEADEDYIVDPGNIMAWERDFNQQFKDPSNGKFYQVISTRNKKPLRIFKERQAISGSSTDSIASRKQDEELTIMDSRKEHNKGLLWIGIIAAMMTLIVIIIASLVARNYIGISTACIPSVIYAFAIMPFVRRKPKEIVGSVTSINSLVIHNDKGIGSYEDLDIKDIPPTSLERCKNGRPFHLVGVDGADGDKKYWSIEPDNDDNTGESPQDCYMALDYPEVPSVFGWNSDTLEKVKLTLFFALVFVDIFVLVLFLLPMLKGA